MTVRGRPRRYADAALAKRAANRRAADRARAMGLVQRSIWLSAEAWERLRAMRHADETTDAQVIARLLQESR